jgi:uncharacterized protein YdaT
MPWDENNYPPEFAGLTPEVRAKAIEIANELIQRQNFDEATAIKEAIRRAEEWEMDRQG